MATNTATTLSDSVVDLMNQAVLISGANYNKVDAYATIREEAQANSIAFTVFSRMGLATTALTDGTEASSTTMTDAKKTLPVAEYGAVITTTSLASIATAGKADLASAELVGINMGETTNKLGLNALEAGTNTITQGTDTLKATLRTAYEALSGDGIAKFEDGRYVAFMPPSMISQIKDDYISIVGNTDANSATSGVVGSLEGFSIVEDSSATTATCFGKNALGLAISQAPEVRITEGNDNLGRTANVGWLMAGAYGVIDEKALRVIA